MKLQPWMKVGVKCRIKTNTSSGYGDGTIVTLTRVVREGVYCDSDLYAYSGMFHYFRDLELIKNRWR